jgi:hypothetical protein
MPRFNWLRSFGPMGSAFANLLAFLTTNWALAVSVALALATGLIGWLQAIALNPIAYVSAGTFLFVLWVLIGILYLVDRGKPRLVRSHLDYRYGLTFEGFVPNYQDPSFALASAGILGFAVQIRNFSPGPIRYEFEYFDIRIGTRALPRIKRRALVGFMARGAGRTASTGAFTPEQLKEFVGKEDTKGTADFSIVYGSVDGPPERRLKMSLEILVVLGVDKRLGFNYNITEETDDDI